MSLTYTQFQSQLLNLTNLSNDANWSTELPAAIDYCEMRLYRELDLLVTVTRDTGTLTSGSRNFTMPTRVGTFLEVNTINVVTPVGTQPENGTRNSLQPVSMDYLDVAWPSATGATVPVYFARLSDTTVLLGPWPDQAYIAEVVGTIRPTPLSTTNATTWLSVYLPDLMIAGAMIHLSGYKANFGAQSDDPKMAQSWESQFQALIKSANTEEMKKRFMAAPPGQPQG